MKKLLLLLLALAMVLTMVACGDKKDKDKDDDEETTESATGTEGTEEDTEETGETDETDETDIVDDPFADGSAEPFVWEDEASGLRFDGVDMICMNMDDLGDMMDSFTSMIPGGEEYIDENGMGATFEFYAFKNDGSSVSVMYIPSEGLTAEEQLEAYAENYGEVGLIQTTDIFTREIGGKSFKAIGITMDLGIPMSQEAAMLAVDDRILLIIFTTTDDESLELIVDRFTAY